jgi:hypothetical protein
MSGVVPIVLLLIVLAIVCRVEIHSARVEMLNQFQQLVAEMRDAQKEYFRERSPQNLAAAKSLEKRVDQALAEVADGQRELFSEEPTV